MAANIRLWLLCVLAVPLAAVARPTVELTPDKVVLGRDQSVRIRVVPEEPSRPLLTAASAGTLLPVPGAPSEFIWTPPELRYPSRAVLLFWEASTGAPDPTVVVLPLYGRTTVDVDTAPGAQVRIKVGDELFGPEIANAKGRVKMSIIVPPGVRSAEAIATSNGLQTNRKVTLQVPRTAAFTAAMGPDPLTVKAGGWIVVAHDEEVPRDQLRVMLSAGTATEELTTAEFTAFRVHPDSSSIGTGLNATVSTSPEEPDPNALRLSAAVTSGAPPPEAPPPVVAARHGVVQLLFGGYLGSGANDGLQLEAAGAMPVPGWGDRLFAELGLGARWQPFEEDVLGIGPLRSQLFAVPITAGARARLFERGPLSLDARAGLGPVLFVHSVSAEFQPTVNQSGVGFDAFAAAQGGYRLKPLELVAELRGDLINARTPRLVARPGGLSLAIGARWELPW